MAHPLGTLLASPIVTGSALDEYGTHYSYLGIGGWQELKNINQRNSIPIDSVNGLDVTELSSGKRRVGMVVYCVEEDTIYQLKIPNYNNLSSSIKLSQLSNNANWEVLSTGGSGTGDSIKRRYTESGHTFTEGDVIAFDGSNYVKASASINGSDNIVGIVTSVVNTDVFEVTYMGYYDTTNLTLTNNTVYFLSPNTAGALTDIEPTSIGQRSKPVLITQSNNEAIILNYPSVIIDEAKASSGTRIQKKITKISHGFTEGDVIGYDGNSYAYAIAQSNTTIEALGIIIEVIDNNNFVLCYSGYVDSITGMTDSSSNALSGNTKYYLSDSVAGKITANKPVNVGTIVRPILITLTETNGNVVQYQGTEVTSGGTSTVSGVIGAAEFGNYDDGIYEDFTQTTPTGTPIDRFNRLLKSLAPTPPPRLSTINRTGGGIFTTAELSFGSSNNDIGYTEVDGSGGVVTNINGTFSANGNRLGVTNVSSLTLKLNGTVGGNANYETGAFIDGNKGKLIVELNGSVLETVQLTGTTTSITQGSVSLSEVKNVTFDNGDPATFFKYRTGNIIITNGSFNNGYNFLRVKHETPTFTGTTSYTEWVYDNNTDVISLSNTPTIDGISLSGSRYISGVQYNTSGTVNYNVSLNNVYRNVYQTGSAISYITRNKLSDAISIIKTSNGGGINSETNASKNLPELNSGSTDPVLDTLNLVSTHSINSSVLGFGTTGTIGTSIQIGHPLKASFIGGTASSQGYLVNLLAPTTNLENEDFTGETYRLENRDYSLLSYNDVNTGIYSWDSSESLVGSDGLHNNGLLVFNDELLYPNSDYLASQYGINNGNFSTISIPVNNPNYTSASGERIFNRVFKSNNTTNQGSLIIEIDYTGSSSEFLLDLENGGTPSENNIKLEFLIMRADNITKYGWTNPFSVFSDSNGYQRQSLSVSGSVITVTTNLDVKPFGENDIIILRVRTSSGWTRRIKNLKINNI